jgi:hypothetical protein
MSKFIIGNKPIYRVSGPVRVTVLKPDNDLKKRFEEEGARLPYIILFGDHHFSRENSCDDSRPSWWRITRTCSRSREGAYRLSLSRGPNSVPPSASAWLRLKPRN